MNNIIAERSMLYYIKEMEAAEPQRPDEYIEERAPAGSDSKYHAWRKGFMIRQRIEFLKDIQAEYQQDRRVDDARAVGRMIAECEGLLRRMSRSGTESVSWTLIKKLCSGDD